MLTQICVCPYVGHAGLFCFSSDGKTKLSINRTLPKQHGDYDGSKFRWCISSICKIQKATVTYIPVKALYKKAFRWYLATTLLFFRFLFLAVSFSNLCPHPSAATATLSGLHFKFHRYPMRDEDGSGVNAKNRCNFRVCIFKVKPP